MSAKPGHETADLPAGPAALAISGLFALIGLGALAAWGLTAAFEHSRPATTPTAFEHTAAVPSAPRLEVDARADRLALEQKAQARLTGYGWSDQGAGLAHIPIDRAMALQAEEGWPDPDTSPTNSTSTTPSTNATGVAP